MDEEMLAETREDAVLKFVAKHPGMHVNTVTDIHDRESDLIGRCEACGKPLFSDSSIVCELDDNLYFCDVPACSGLKD